MHIQLDNAVLCVKRKNMQFQEGKTRPVTMCESIWEHRAVTVSPRHLTETHNTPAGPSAFDHVTKKLDSAFRPFFPS